MSIIKNQALNGNYYIRVFCLSILAIAYRRCLLYAMGGFGGVGELWKMFNRILTSITAESPPVKF